MHSSGFEQTFDLGDRFYTSATSSSGDLALVYLQGPQRSVFVLDAIAGTSRAINLPDDVANNRVTMSPDGVTLLATTSYYPNSGLLGADLTTGAVELDWVVLEQDIEISIAGFIWESSTHFRSGSRIGLLDIHLITTP